MPRLNVGNIIAIQQIETINNSSIELPLKTQLTHIQFRRFSGCPVCTLHLQEFVQRHIDLVSHGVREIAVFHSSKTILLEHEAVIPFAVIADPEKKLYEQFGVEKSIVSLAHPTVWLSATRGMMRFGFRFSEKAESLIGLPADFLIGKEGEILACKYGKHADDSWSVDELLALVLKLT